MKFVCAIDDTNATGDTEEKHTDETDNTKNKIKLALEGKRTNRLQKPFLVHDSGNQGNKGSNRNICPVKTYNEHYCSDNRDIINDTSVIIGNRSPMGTGKTYQAMQKVEQGLENNPDAHIIINSFRVSLANKYKEEYSKLGFWCYNEDRAKKIDNTVKKLIIQLDSYNRIYWIKTDVDLMVIDEISQVRQHLTNGTFLGNDKRADNWTSFKWCVKKAKQILLMDANLTAQDIKFIQDIRGKRTTTQVYHNEFKFDQGLAHITDNPYTIVRQVQKKLKEGKRCFVAHNGSKEKIHALAKLFTKKSGGVMRNTLIICQDTIHKDNVKKALEKPNCLDEEPVRLSEGGSC